VLSAPFRTRVPVRASVTRYLDSMDQAGYLSVRLFNAEGTGFNLSPDGGERFCLGSPVHLVHCQQGRIHTTVKVAMPEVLNGDLFLPCLVLLHARSGVR